MGLSEAGPRVFVAEQGPLLMSLTYHDDILYVAGGRRGQDGGRLYQIVGGLLQRLDIPVGRLLWWVWGSTDTLFACGEGGRIIMRRNGAWRTFRPSDDDRVTFWGGWSRAMVHLL